MDRRPIETTRTQVEQASREWSGRALTQAPPSEAYAADHPKAAVVAKRAIDIVGATLLLILLSPLFLVLAVMIKLDSPGSIQFRHTRIGRDGVPFQMRKFRTMIPDAELRKLEILHLNDAADGFFKVHQDPRVTRFGRLMRSTSLDELPQLLHVVSGRMSLVGPRPLVPEEEAAIPSAIEIRRSVRPGITGTWQVEGASRIPLKEMAVIDAGYVENWSLLNDLKLILRTIPHVVRRRGI